MHSYFRSQKSWLQRLSLLLFMLLTSLTHPLIGKSGKVLIVATNVAEVNGKVNGTYLMEIAIPFHCFVQKGYEVEVVSPKGGKVAIYHKGDTVPILKSIAQNNLFIQKTQNSLQPKKVNAGDYCAIIFPGGYGHFWDVFTNSDIASLAARIYESGGYIGSLGHGAADLLNIRLSSGEFFVKGKLMTCFPSWFEREYMTEANYGELLPVDMQQELSARGAHLKVCTWENKESNVDITVVDRENRLVTAAFADGGEFVATEILKLLHESGR